MRRLLTILVATFLVASGAAWAVIQESSLNITDKGQPLPGATIVLKKTVVTNAPRPKKVVDVNSKPKPSVSASKPKPVHVTRRDVPRRISIARRKANERGFVLLTFDDAGLSPNEVVSVEIVSRDGRRRQFDGISVGDLVRGGTIDLVDGPRFGERAPGGPQFVQPGAPLASSGVYIGVNAGVVAPNASATWLPNPAGFGLDTAPLASFAQTSFNAAQFTVGGQIGIDFMVTPNIVLGAVADINFKTNGQQRFAPYASPAGLFPIAQRVSSPFETTERLRVGAILPLSSTLSIMPYITGGAAFAQISSSDGMYFPASFNFGSSSQMRAGWAAGVGLEFMTVAGCRMQVQWLHEDFGSFGYVAPNSLIAASFIQAGRRISQDRVTIGLNIGLDRLGALISPR